MATISNPELQLQRVLSEVEAQEVEEEAKESFDR
jgi:hypothetical protein